MTIIGLLIKILTGKIVEFKDVFQYKLKQVSLAFLSIGMLLFLATGFYRFI